MPSVDRDSSHEREGRIRHQSSFSESSRALVPMWDSSDPDRAPPPLPLNPSSPVGTSKPNVSSTVAQAAAALSEKARESAGPSSYTTNPMQTKRDLSPEKYHHKRIQSLQTGSSNVKDLSNYLENGSRSPERSPERSSPRAGAGTFSRDWADRSPEKSPTRSGTPTDTGTMRSSSRQPPKSILGENTPPTSATMKALQNMQTPPSEAPLSEITNSSTARTPHNTDALSTQILSLTTIATNLQREMAQLSRRSKDNATDLISLKEATNARDEDIRKSLRELLASITSGLFGSKGDTGFDVPKDSPKKSASASYMLDSKPWVSPPAKNSKSGFTLPRIPSPNSFAANIERELNNSPSPYSMDGAANLALLEKIFREMGTKDGQEQLLSAFTDLLEKHGKSAGETAKKLDELNGTIKDVSSSRALVVHDGGRSRAMTPEENSSGPLTRIGKDGKIHALLPGRGATPANSNLAKPYASATAADFVSEDVQNLLRRLKDSVAENGGLTAEVKALVRELRGEVLGMGRELGRKLTDADSHRIENHVVDESARKQDVANIVGEGLHDLKNHLELVMREKRRQSSSSSISRNTVDSQEVFDAVKHAMQDMQLQHQVALGASHGGLEKDDILNAVREAWETYKPEIELQNFGLERDEILQCLKEGLEDYRPAQMNRDLGASRDEVLDAIRDGMENFHPPAPIETEAAVTREEMLSAFRECLETFDLPLSNSARGPDITRDDVVDAVREGLDQLELPSNNGQAAREMDFTRDDVFDAVRAGLEGARTPMGGFGDQVLERLQEVIEGMRVEFKGVSEEAKQNVAANGRDTEQVLDAMKDGLECLRSDIETYVDRAADVTGKDEIIETIRDSLDSLRADAGRFGERSLDQPADGEMLEAMKSEFEHLREILATTLVRGQQPLDRDELYEVMRDSLDGLKADLNKNQDRPESILSGTGEILDALNDGLDELRADVQKMVEKPVDMTVSYEILDTLKDGLANVRQDLDTLKGERSMERVLGPEDGQIVVAENLKRNDIENLEVMITQLRIKVEALDALSQEQSAQPRQATPADGDGLTREDLAQVEESLGNVHAALTALSERERETDEDTVRKDDIDAIETLLINTKAKIDDLALSSEDMAATKEQLGSVENVVRDMKDNLEDFTAHAEAGTATKEDLGVIEALLSEVKAGVDEMKDKAAEESLEGEKVTKTDIDAVEGLCSDIKQQIEQMILPDLETLTTKEDISLIQNVVGGHKLISEQHHEATVQAFEDRRLENEELVGKLDELQSLMEGVKSEFKVQLGEGHGAVESLGRLMEEMGEKLGDNSEVSTSVKETIELITREFERSHGLGEGIKLDQEEQGTVLLKKLDERFDELMTKYDDAQLAADAKAKVTEEKDMEKDEILLGTKTVAEDLKLLVDTLGTTVTEAADKMGNDSQTVFGRVDENCASLEDARAESKVDHQLTRAEVQRVISEVGSLRGEVSEHNPRVLDSLRDVLTLVGEHFEHSKEAAQRDNEREIVVSPAAPMESNVPAIVDSIPEKYDDSTVQTKLDQLIDRSEMTESSLAKIEILDQIHQQMKDTAAELSGFMAVHAQSITEGSENKERQAEEAALALERSLAHKERIESDVNDLLGEKETLQDVVGDLKNEKDDLSLQKMRLTADVASLETALRLRHEELMMMEARAEKLERRILEGVIDHSRALLISRPSKDTDDMSLKRVRNASSTTTSSLPRNAVGMTLKSRPPPIRMNAESPRTAGRRILSLNQITNNVPTGGHAFSSAPSDRGLTNLKRSHSVKTSSGGSPVAGSLRKSSWVSQAHSQRADKENHVFEEEGSEDEYSDSGTERRTSLGTTVDRRTSYGTSTDRRSSFGTVTGTLGTESLIEEGDESEEAEENTPTHQQMLAKPELGRMVMYDGMADSGMGTEIETPGLHTG
ncbi:MAG: hypothetical protein M4579_000936 [Chaenotheca gracillima]|nr:MAG: hypothetical protein M4579_000936 [Chaenotheca gracillima]